MASGPGEQPPALPVKQHRSHSSRFSSQESDCALPSPVGPNYTYIDVFSEAPDCHAAQCPIHQQYDPFQHQVRFFSDGTPPPVPKKRLARTLSLPETHAPPLPPLQRQPQNFDNPLYMLAPIPDTYSHGETEEFQPVRGSPVPFLTLSQLSFDTPDEHLPYLFGSFDDQRAVFQEIQLRHLLFLRSAVQSMEAGILLQNGATEVEVISYQPEDFLLCEGSKPKQIGDTVYFRLHSPKLPGRVLGLRVHKQTDESSSAHTKHQPSHVNVRDVIAHFQPRNTQRTDSSKLQTQDPSCSLKSDCNAARTCRDSTEFATDCMTTKTELSTVQSFLQKGHPVSVQRDLPHATLEDFVQESLSLPSEDCLDYDRQVCVLLVQVLIGLQHLYISGTAAELRPQEVLLVWPNREKQESTSGVKRGCRTKEVEWEKTPGKGTIQMFWRTCGNPRVVLTPLSSSLPVSHLLTYIKSQIIALIQYCLNSKESATSSYRTGLLHLSSLLQNERSAPQVTDMVVMLQVILWGPRVPLFDHRGSVTTNVHNWLTVKRALLLMKLAERGLIQDRSGLDWEDCMCLQYLSFTDPEIIVSIAGQLWLTVNLE
ncbi:inactive tyrosine-protein kinase PEAK1 [Tautogolabrus adspersus]